ncbi:uncharacterized protein LOC123962210 isoform X2 [Micropterus dolomieu]|uniref:uncharacterized protein LOC123962210 isoform X2 n=1 Tax=Micropterus dolomieu TaxID=147949 RepID=UPI001E8CE821|nr:uncharacterized protein LOC123962210 isoform X2 [Micropterus dolomieu]
MRTEGVTDRDIRLMIQLRATNAAIFTGRRNSAMRGWRAIRKEMGLQGMLSARQLKKKWDNLKEKYRLPGIQHLEDGDKCSCSSAAQSQSLDFCQICWRADSGRLYCRRSMGVSEKALKNPPEGMETTTPPSSWRWFHLMEEAMSGRLAGTANIIQPSLLDEDEDNNAALPPLIIPNMGGAFSGLVGTGTLEGAGTPQEVLDLSEIESCGKVEAVSRTESPAEVVAAEGHTRRPECELSQPAALYVTLLPDRTNETPSSSRNIVREASEVDRKLAELQTERRALEREQAEFDRELIALERDRELLSRDMATLERDRTAIDRDRAAVERDRAAVERDRVFLDRDRAFLDRDRAFLERDRVFLERAREDLERARALLRRERAVLEREGAAVDGHQAEMTAEKEVVLQTRFYQSLMAGDLDPDQLETRQRLVSLFQRLVEKL